VGPAIVLPLLDQIDLVGRNVVAQQILPVIVRPQGAYFRLNRYPDRVPQPAGIDHAAAAIRLIAHDHRPIGVVHAFIAGRADRYVQGTIEPEGQGTGRVQSAGRQAGDQYPLVGYAYGGLVIAPGTDLTLLGHVETPVMVGHAVRHGETTEQGDRLGRADAALPVEQHAHRPREPGADKNIALRAERHQAWIIKSGSIDRDL